MAERRISWRTPLRRCLVPRLRSDGHRRRQLLEPRKVFDAVRAVGSVRKYPADVCPPEAARHRRVKVVSLIRVGVVVAMVSGPTQRPGLDGHSPEPGQHKLKQAASLKPSVREIAMIRRDVNSRTDKVRRNAEADERPRKFDEGPPDGGPQVKADDDDAGAPVDLVQRPYSNPR